MDILSFFKWTNEFLALIVAIGGSGATLFGLIYSHLKRQKAEESIAEKLSSIDLQQNEKLQQMDASVQELAVIVTNTQEILNILQKEKLDKAFLDNLKVKISDLGDTIMKVHHLDNAFESLIVEATEKAGSVFKDIWRTGYVNWDTEVLARKITSAMRSLRTYYTGHVVTPPEVIEEIQRRVAQPAIKRLLTSLEMFKSGQYNGSTSKKYEEVVLNFCREMIEGGIEINHSIQKRT